MAVNASFKVQQVRHATDRKKEKEKVCVNFVLHICGYGTVHDT